MPGPSPASSYPGYPSLSSDQQKLLLAALSSNSSNRSLNMNDFLASAASQQPQDQGLGTSTDTARSTSEGIDPSVFDADRRAVSLSEQPTYGDGMLPDIVNGTSDFDVDVDLPQNDYDGDDGFGSFDNYDGDFGEKRKSPEDDEDDEEGDSKRREGDDKAPKKPGRKPLTSEPTTKRKAQNRAAQRAFRERKEKHLKDLELKVSSLEQASESANHENDLLRAQISKLQNELQEYRKRLSLAGNALNGSPPASDSADYMSRNNRSSTNSGTFDFQFDFPAFGDLFHGNNSSANQSNSPTNVNNNDFGSLVKQESDSRSNSTAASPQQNGLYSTNGPSLNNSKSNTGRTSLSNSASGNTPTGGAIFTPSIFGFNDNSYGFPAFGSPSPLLNGGNTSTQNAPRANSAQAQSQSSTASATSNAASPSNSSISHNGAISSTGTSPEPSNGYSNGDNAHKAKQNGGLNAFNSFQDSSVQGNNVDLSTFQFDPTLFGGYRETQDAIFGDGDFSGGLYDDYLNLPELDQNSLNFGNNNNSINNRNTPMTQPTPKPTLMDKVEKHQEGCSNGSVHTAEKLEENNMMTAHKMWEQLSTCPKFKDGDLDIDGLCSELSKKATCSDSGAVIPKAEWEAALWRLVGQDNPNDSPKTNGTTAQ